MALPRSDIVSTAEIFVANAFFSDVNHCRITCERTLGDMGVVILHFISSAADHFRGRLLR
jgi:hypothetical protein